MSAAPDWLNDTVQAFGRQMGLKNFALNERGAAGLRFENGIGMALEYGNGALVLSLRLAMQPLSANVTRLLSQAHYRNGDGCRCYYLNRTGEGGCALVLPEGQVSVTSLENAFQLLWKRMEYLRRNL